MADGSYQFQQPAGRYFIPHQPQTNHHQSQRNHIGRTGGSPVNSGRVVYATDTPSPSHSPGPQSPAHNPYAMFNQGHQQGQHPMMNGGPSSQRYQMQLNMAHKFQQQQQQAQHAQQQGQQHHHLQQDHTGHNGPGSSGIGHNQSYSGGLSSTTPHFTPVHLQNGTPGSGHSGMGKPMTEHWTQQLQLAAESRQAGSPHHYARLNAHDNKGVTKNPANTQEKDMNEEERGRASNNSDTRRQDWMSLDFGGQGLRALSSALFEYTFLDKIHLCYNKLTHLPPDIGKLKNLRFLDLSGNQLSELPPEIGMLTSLKTLLLFDNNLRTLPYEMGSLFQLEILGVEGNPLDEELKSEIMQNGTEALITHLREQAPVTLPPSQRDWIILDDTPAASSNSPGPEKFTALTYNILCEKYATEKQYGYTPSLALSWSYRKELILQEIREQSADIVCLQEVDMDSFNEYFRPQLAYNDYKGVFWPKSRARTMAEKEAKQVDGCATFYKGSKYIILDKQMVDFANTAINRPDMKGEHDIFNRVMPRDNIAVITFLENRMTGTRIIVVNAHIYWDPAFKDVKLVQVAILMEQLSRLAEKYVKMPALAEKDKKLLKTTDSGVDANGNIEAELPAEPAPSAQYSSAAQIPLLICGDFNSTAGSGVYDFLAHGQLANTHSDLANRGYGNFTRDGMTHPFTLRSSYSNVGELSFTNYTPGFTGAIDYIWYSTNTLQVTALLGEVDKEYLQRVPGFPNYHFPSDHLALLAEFSVKGRKDAKKIHPEPDFGPQRDRKGGRG